MHFSDTLDGTGSKFTKIAIVGALHLAVGAALIHNMNAKSFSMPKVVEELVMMNIETPKPPPPPPEPPQAKQKPVTQPKIVAPKVEVEVKQEPTEAPVVQTAAEPTPADPGPATPVEEAAPANPNAGKLFSAALADAGGCAKPDYPAKAARNGETGTVSLALLIGTDGHVSDSKVQKSSGSKELDRAAQQALSLCTFKPAINNGRAEPGWGQIAYIWTLD
jgi:protein TonB